MSIECRLQKVCSCSRELETQTGESQKPRYIWCSVSSPPHLPPSLLRLTSRISKRKPLNQPVWHSRWDFVLCTNSVPWNQRQCVRPLTVGNGLPGWHFDVGDASACEASARSLTRVQLRVSRDSAMAKAAWKFMSPFSCNQRTRGAGVRLADIYLQSDTHRDSHRHVI